MRIGALEAGGTKMVCAIGNEKGEIFEKISIPTKTPETTMPEMIQWFKAKKIEALGIGCFGPIDPDKDSPTYGYITSTPKLAWKDYNIVGAFEECLCCPVGFDTDVNGSALGEVTFGQAKGKKNIVYLTVGTGIGAGVYAEGKLLHGMLHPEAGHILMRRREDDHYEGKCPYHKTCLEGLADCDGCVYQPYCGTCPVISYARYQTVYPSMLQEYRCRIYKGIQDILFEKLEQQDEEVVEIFRRWCE